MVGALAVIQRNVNKMNEEIKETDKKIKCKIAGCTAVAEVFDFSLKSGRMPHTYYCDDHAWAEYPYREDFLFAVSCSKKSWFERNHLFVYIPGGLNIEDRSSISKAIREM